MKQHISLIEAIRKRVSWETIIVWTVILAIAVFVAMNFTDDAQFAPGNYFEL